MSATVVAVAMLVGAVVLVAVAVWLIAQDWCGR